MEKTKMEIQLKDLKIRTVEIPIVGISPLIVNKFSEKARRMIEEKQQRKTKSSKHEKRIPEEDYKGAKHISTEGWEGFPASGFKAALVRGAKIVGLVMKDVQTSIFIEADCQETQLVRIIGESRLRTDPVRLGMGSTDLRYRPEYVNWEAVLTIEYNEGMISTEQLFQIVMVGGRGCGIGEMRPERGRHSHGRFTLKQ